MSPISHLEMRVHSLELIVAEKMSNFTPIDLMRTYNKIMHESIDWHEFSNYLDELNTKGVVKCTGHDRDGMTRYSLNH